MILLMNSSGSYTLENRLRAEAILTELKRRQKGTALPLPTPHSGQVGILSSPARFRVLNCGRQLGKSTAALIALVREAERTKGGVYYWIWPSYPTGHTGCEMLRTACAGIKWTVSEGRRRVQSPHGAAIWIKSADNPDGLRGIGLRGAVLDECREMSGRLWPEIIRPALAAAQGWAMFLSTPRGFDWFHALYQNALDNGAGGEWAAWTHPTADNPAIDCAELASIEATTPSLIWRQEYLADFGAGAELGVFRGVRDCIYIGESDTPLAHKGHRVVMGVDFAQSTDFTALSIMCADCKRQMELDRFNRMEWAIVRARIKAAAERWGVTHIEAESNSIGGPNIEALQADGLPVRGFETTATSKPPIIQSLALAFERREIAILNNAVQLSELESYETKPSKATGRPTYSAPEGMHDDTVIALALAWRATTQGGSLLFDSDRVELAQEMAQEMAVNDYD